MQDLLAIVLANAVMATLLALFAAFVTHFIRRPALKHVLWLLVLVKLITPPAWTLPSGWLEPKPEQQVATETAVDPTAWLVEHATHVSLQPQAATPESLEFLVSMLEAAEEEVTVPEVTEPSEPVASWWADVPWRGILAGLWLGGVSVWLTVAAYRIYRFQRLLGYGTPAPAELQKATADISDRMGLTWCPQVWIVPGRVSPLLWAFGRRIRLVLPEQLLAELGPQQLTTLLAHELAHARRHDYWVRWLELLVTSVYWWHPIAWWARYEVQQAEEQCCDAWVVAMFPAAAKAYAKALLQTVTFLDARPALPPAASGAGHVSLIRRRLQMIVNNPLNPRLSWPGLLGAMLLGLAVLPTVPDRLQARLSPIAIETEADPQARSQRPDERELRERIRSLKEELNRLSKQLEETSAQTEKKETPKERVKTEVKEKVKAATKAPAAAQKRIVISGDGKELTPEKREEIHKQIHEALHKAMGPEQMKQIEIKVHEALQKSLGAEHLKEIDSKVHEALHKNLSPERMKQIEVQIQNAMKKIPNVESKEFQIKLGEAMKKVPSDEKRKEIETQVQEAMKRSKEAVEKSEAVRQKAMAESAKNREKIMAEAAKNREKAQAQAEKARELAAEAREKARAQAEKAREAANKEKAKAEKSKEQPAPRAVVATPARKPVPASEAGKDKDFEKRLDSLEKKMDQLIKLMEATRRQGSRQLN